MLAIGGNRWQETVSMPSMALNNKPGHIIFGIQLMRRKFLSFLKLKHWTTNNYRRSGLGRGGHSYFQTILARTHLDKQQPGYVSRIWTGTYKGTALILMSPKCSPERQLFDWVVIKATEKENNGIWWWMTSHQNIPQVILSSQDIPFCFGSGREKCRERD